MTQYRIGIINNETRPVSFGDIDWINNEPFDGITVTDEPFNIGNYFNYRLKDGVWILAPLPEPEGPEPILILTGSN